MLCWVINRDCLVTPCFVGFSGKSQRLLHLGLVRVAALRGLMFCLVCGVLATDFLFHLPCLTGFVSFQHSDHKKIKCSLRLRGILQAQRLQQGQETAEHLWGKMEFLWCGPHHPAFRCSSPSPNKKEALRRVCKRRFPGECLAMSCELRPICVGFGEFGD